MLAGVQTGANSSGNDWQRDLKLKVHADFDPAHPSLRTRPAEMLMRMRDGASLSEAIHSSIPLCAQKIQTQMFFRMSLLNRCREIPAKRPRQV